ncbi:pheromone-regulated protein prm10 [Rhodotorula toruloides]
MAPDEPPLDPPAPALPDLASSSVQANDFVSVPVTPVPTPPIGTPDGAATPGTPGATAKPARRVQWNEQVSAHVSVPFFSESAADAPSPSLSGEAGAKRRRKSLSLAEKGGVDDRADPFHDRYRLDDVPVSLVGGEADGAIEGIVDPVVKKLEVWVDPLERDGLPSMPAASAGLGTNDAAVESEEKAKGLVGQYTTGAMGLWEGLRQRRASISRMRRFEEDVLHGKAGPTSPRDLGTSDEESQAGSPTAPSAPQGNAGILAALIALSQQEAAAGGGSAPGSASSSAIPTPLSSVPPSPTLAATPSADYDSSDDEYERERFIARLRAKRASKNALHAASTSVASASKHAAGTAIRLATGGAFKHDRGRQSAGTSGRSTRAPSEDSSELSKRVRKLGDRLGLELETERTRPKAARSEAGVFGGLVFGATSLVAPATPSGTTIAPIPTRPGYHLSRYSAPDVNRHTRSGSASPSPSSSARALSPPPPPRPLSPPARTASSAPRSPESSRKSLSEMVREEEERDKSGNAAQMLQERRGRRKKAIFSLHVETEDDKDGNGSGSGNSSPRPVLSIDTSALSPPHALPPPTRSPISPTASSATFRFLGAAKSPKSPTGSFSSLHREYFSSGHLSPVLTPAEKERERAERRAKEEAKERERDLREWQKEKRRRKRAREKELKARRVFITAHVAAIIERQEFILKLARAFMMFGAPSHRLEAQLQATARVLELPHCACLYLPGCLLVNFGDPATFTSDIRFLKQASGLDIGKLKSTYWIYHKVIRDKISVGKGSTELDDLMTSPPKYGLLHHVVVGGLAGAFIMPSAFYGSFIDCLVAIPLGSLLVIVQVFLARNDMYSSLFEIVIACINAVIAGALSYTGHFCFYSVAAGSIVLILPGFIVLCAALELANRSIVSGAVRITYAALYSLFLGFGLSVGAEIYTMGGRESIAGGDDYTCAYLREGAPWYRQTIPQWFYFLTVPGFLLCMALKNGQPLFRRDTLAMLFIGSAGFATNFFSARAFSNMPALTSMLGSFVVGVSGNVWSKATRESAFVVMIVGIFIQLPSGLANGGLLRFASDSATSQSNSFSTAVDSAAGLIRVAVGMTVGLFLAAALMNVISRRGRSRGAYWSPSGSETGGEDSSALDDTSTSSSKGKGKAVAFVVGSGSSGEEDGDALPDAGEVGPSRYGSWSSREPTVEEIIRAQIPQLLRQIDSQDLDSLLPYGIADYTFSLHPPSPDVSRLTPEPSRDPDKPPDRKPDRISLGRGKFSEVLLVRKGDTEYALKHTPLHPHHHLISTRLLREPLILAQLLPHRNLVKVFETIRTPGHFYLVEENLRSSVTLEALVTSSPGGILPLDQAWSVLEQLSSVVKSLHEPLRVCHRDIKPENILVRLVPPPSSAPPDTPPTLLLKLLDFGLATHFSSSTPKLTTCCGSPAYHSPELWRGLRDKSGSSRYYGAEIDIWCTGLTVLRCLSTNRYPLGLGHQSMQELADKAVDALLAVEDAQIRQVLAGFLHLDGVKRMRAFDRFCETLPQRLKDRAAREGRAEREKEEEDGPREKKEFKTTTFVPAPLAHRLPLCLDEDSHARSEGPRLEAAVVGDGLAALVEQQVLQVPERVSRSISSARTLRPGREVYASPESVPSGLTAVRDDSPLSPETETSSTYGTESYFTPLSRPSISLASVSSGSRSSSPAPPTPSVESLSFGHQALPPPIELTLLNPHDEPIRRAVSYIKYALRCKGILYHVRDESTSSSSALSDALSPYSSPPSLPPTPFMQPFPNFPFVDAPTATPSRASSVRSSRFDEESFTCYLQCVVALPSPNDPDSPETSPFSATTRLRAALDRSETPLRPGLPSRRHTYTGNSRSAWTPPDQPGRSSGKKSKKVEALVFFVSIRKAGSIGPDGASTPVRPSSRASTSSRRRVASQPTPAGMARADASRIVITLSDARALPFVRSALAVEDLAAKNGSGDADAGEGRGRGRSIGQTYSPRPGQGDNSGSRDARARREKRASSVSVAVEQHAREKRQGDAGVAQGLGMTMGPPALKPVRRASQAGKGMWEWGLSGLVDRLVGGGSS